MIQVSSINKSFSGLQVLNDVSLSINEGELVAIVGASGAGKTTLLQIMGTLERPDTGQVLIADTDLSKLSEKKLAKFRNENIGFIFQFHQLLPEFTALENVCLPAWINKGDQAATKARAEELLTLLGMGHRMDHKPNALSGGEAQRVAVARALINKPAVVFADEPSGNLDSKNAKELHELFFKLRDHYKQTFVIVTHNETLAESADRTINMRDGRVI